jgi:hypothetical protein
MIAKEVLLHVLDLASAYCENRICDDLSDDNRKKFKDLTIIDSGGEERPVIYDSDLIQLVREAIDDE